MDYLRAAVSLTQQALAKGSGIYNLPNFGLGDRKPEFDGLSLWTLYDGYKRDDDSPVSIFVFDANTPTSSRTDKRTLMALAKNAVKKLRALRHPDILKYIDSSESDTAIYLITEPIVPLSKRIGRDGDVKPNSQSALETGTGEEWRIWGLSKVVNALSFINDSGASTHGNLKVSSIFVTPSGEWKLGGFEVLSSPKDATPLIYTHGSFVPEANKYASPEVLKGGYEALKDLNVSALDSYQLYLFLHVLFNGPLPFVSSPSDIPSARGQIPPQIFPHARRLYSPTTNPNARLKPSTFLALGNSTDPSSLGFFRSNRLVNLAESLDSFALASEMERAALINTIKSSLEGATKLSDEFAKWKVLPSVTKALEFGPGGPQLLPLILSIGQSSNLTAAEYEKFITGSILKSFASPDRAMRLALLEALPQYIDKLDNKQVCDKVWPNLMTGFGDAVPIIREATVKSVLLIAPKLTDRILNNDLLRHLAKTQMDAEPGIRTNTCILLGRLSKHLQPATNSKVLVPAFSRAMRDPFLHARIAGLMALMATVEIFNKEDLAGRCIPAMSITLVDKEKIVRDQAFKAMEMFVKKLETIAASMPETDQQPQSATNQSQVNGFGSTPSPSTPSLALPTIPTSAAGAATALAGWAMTSFAKKLVPSDLQTGIGGLSPASNRPSSTPPSMQQNGLSGSVTLQPSPLSRTTSFPAPPIPSSSTRPPATSTEDKDLMNVTEDDWDPLEAFSEPIAADTVEEQISETDQQLDLFAAMLSTTSPSKKLTAKKPASSMQLGANKPKPDAFLDSFDDAHWDDVAPPAGNLSSATSSRASTPAQSHQVKTTASGWNDPPATSEGKLAVKSKPARAVRAKSPLMDHAASSDGWSDFDKADKATESAWKQSDDWESGPPPAASSNAKSKVAQMREERKARMAALKATTPAVSNGIASQPPAAKFTSGANTQHRF